MTDDGPRGNRRAILTAGTSDASDGLLREPDEGLAGPRRLRELAHWYREFAERAGNPVVWEGRVRTAEDLDAEADRIERGRGGRD